MEFKGFHLDVFQEESINAIEKNNSVVVSAPTGSGKTLIADYIIKRDLEQGLKVIYTAPIKALSNQKYKEFSQDYGEKNIGLLTGDIVKNPAAPILIMTTEIYRNMVLINDPLVQKIKYVIFDEIHYINDIERGYVWEESIIFSPEQTRFLCLSATIPNAQEFADWINHIKKHKVKVITHDKRNVPLHRKFYDSELGITTLTEIKKIADIPDYKHIHGRQRRRGPYVKPPRHTDLVRKLGNKLPCFFFTFSRQKCQDYAHELWKCKLFPHNPEITKIIRHKLESCPPEINNLKSTRLFREVLPYGIGFHHAGLLPIIKELVEELFGKGLIKVLYTTETFAVGINMPAKTVCFDSLRKFDGINFRYLNSKEYFQIAGRAGRRGIDKEGFVYAMVDRRDFDLKILKRMTIKDVEPIHSQFKLSINTVLNLIKQHNQKEIDLILAMNFHTYQKYGRKKVSKSSTHYTFNKLRKKLAKFGYVDGNDLTTKGEFSSHIYQDEIIYGELFATSLYQDFNEYQILMVIACLCYEAREKTEFYNTYPSAFLKGLHPTLNSNPILAREKRFYELEELTALIHPVYHGQTIFEVLKNTNLLEGDVIRFYRQILDRIGQIKGATNDARLIELLGSCKRIILDAMEDIDVI